MQSPKHLIVLEDMLLNLLMWWLANGLIQFLTNVSLTLRLFITWKLAFPKGSDLRAIRRVFFYYLISDVTYQYFCHIVLGIHTDHLWASAGGNYTRCKYQGSEITGAIMKLVFDWMDWTPASWCHLMPDHKSETLYGISCWEYNYFKNIPYLLKASCSLLICSVLLVSPMPREVSQRSPELITNPCTDHNNSVQIKKSLQLLLLMSMGA